MITAIVTALLLYGIVLALFIIAHRRNRRMVVVALARSWLEFRRLLPRMVVGVVGSGFIARVLPSDVISAWIGGESGILGVTIAIVAGALTPGGPVVGYSLGSAALKAGAGAPQVVAYVTGWTLYTFSGMVIWELPTMPAWFVKLRLLVSLPFPFIAAWLATWLQR